MTSSQEKMQKIRSLIYVCDSNGIKGYGIVTSDKITDTRTVETSLSAPYFALFINPSKDEENIESVYASYSDGDRRYTKMLDTEVQNIGLFLNSDTLKQSGSLSEKVSQYLSFYTNTDVLALSVDPIGDTDGLISSPSSSSTQMGVDAFVIGVSGYLIACNFLMEEDVYMTLPFTFTLPFHTVGENLLNTNMFKYMSYPSTAVVTHSTYCSPRVLFEHILQFCNEWGPIFDDGPIVDFNPAIMDTTAGYCKLVVSDLSMFQENTLFMRDEMMNMQTEMKNTIESFTKSTTRQMQDQRSLISGEVERVLTQKADEMQELKNNIERIFDRKSRELQQMVDEIVAEKLTTFQLEIQDILIEELKRSTEKRKSKYRRSHKHHKNSRRKYEDDFES